MTLPHYFEPTFYIFVFKTCLTMAKKRKTAAIKQSTVVTNAAGNKRNLGTSSSQVASSVQSDSFSFPLESLLLATSSGGHYHVPSSLVELHPEKVWIVRDFLTVKECNEFIKCSDASEHLEYTSQPGTKYMAHRECYRIQQTDAHELAARLYDRLVRCNTVLQDLQTQLKEISKKRPPYRPVGFNPNIRLYKYTKGHSFGKHVDESNKVDGMGTTEITILVYLSECQGGATRFYPPYSRKSFSFDPKPGTMLLHVHGDECLEHEADPVLDGIKYVLRTDLVFAHD